MPEYRRANVPGGIVFFTVNTFRRGKFLTHEPFRDALRHGIATARADLPFVIVAWVLLPEHLHCIWRLPEGDADFFQTLGDHQTRGKQTMRASGRTRCRVERIKNRAQGIGGLATAILRAPNLS